jgi:hypothetical protein
MMIGPLLLAFALHLGMPSDMERPLWGYLLFVVSFDVAHVWTTIYLTYFDPDERRRRPRVYALIPLAAAFTSFALCLYSPVVFWTALAYIAIGHFIKQQIGFLALYSAKEEPSSQRDRSFDRFVVWVGALGPILLWHADPTEIFDWFDSGEQFLVRLPPIEAAVVTLMAVTASAWLVRQLFRWRAGTLRAPRVLWVACCWVSWWYGLRVAEHFFVAAAFINLFHGIPYTMLVWRRLTASRRLRAEQSPPSVSRWVANGGHWIVFYLSVLLLALLEEGLWDTFVWGQYGVQLFGLDAPHGQAVTMALWVALLSLPQVTHYALDGVIWKGGTNPDVKDIVVRR